jgi:uncharacterized damage-inducible protein DinB
MLHLDEVQRLYSFHHWATDRAFDALAEITADQLDRAWGGSFGTGRALLRHVVGVERLWLERWQGSAPSAIPDVPAANGREFRAHWQAVKTEQLRYLQALTPAALAAPLEYVNLKGQAWRYPMHEIMQHCVNHGTYHRGQITHLLRDLGLSAPQTDWLIFLDQEGKGG